MSLKVHLYESDICYFNIIYSFLFAVFAEILIIVIVYCVFNVASEEFRRLRCF